MRKRYNTPHRSRVVKTRMTEEEYAEFAERLSAYNMSQAEFIRQAITGATIKAVKRSKGMNECSYDENKTRRQDIEIYYSFVGKVDLPE